MAKGFLYRFCMCIMGRKGFIVLWKAALSNHGSPRVVVTRRTTTDQGPRRNITGVDTRSRVTEDEAGWAEHGQEQDLEKIPRNGGIPWSPRISFWHRIRGNGKGTKEIGNGHDAGGFVNTTGGE